MHSSRTPVLAFTLAAALLAAPAFGRSEIFTLNDPRGDDHGDGNYVYPLNDELNEGDLDLLSLTARREGAGTQFELTFARPVKTPGRVAIDYSGTQLDTVARFGFYTLNVDLYIDMDRAPGSGGTSMLPGRLAEIDPASAWERAVVLTPRPHEARGELKRMLARQLRQDARDEDSDLGQAQLEALQKQIPGDVESRIFFPTQVRVRGSKISFFVPDSFLGGPAKDTWSYVVAVSAADLLQSFDVNRALGRQSEDEEALMILPVSPGKWQDRIGGGREGAPLQPPLMDIIAPEGRKQETILGDFDSRARRPAVLPGVVPAEQPKKK
ncbi:MAG TPA: glucodextranase DOMON-like domain-containing protein [Thermoanaerobaculia bacterium]|nr:glucodextranase DOMON-like domain-containing protein [Thermoanaerobaculia bacterium]